MSQSPEFHVNCLLTEKKLSIKSQRHKEQTNTKKILNTFAGSQGHRLTKKNCLSVELLPTPRAHCEMKPEMLININMVRAGFQSERD